MRTIDTKLRLATRNPQTSKCSQARGLKRTGRMVTASDQGKVNPGVHRGGVKTPPMTTLAVWMRSFPVWRSLPNRSKLSSNTDHHSNQENSGSARLLSKFWRTYSSRLGHFPSFGDGSPKRKNFGRLFRVERWEFGRLSEHLTTLSCSWSRPSASPVSTADS